MNVTKKLPVALLSLLVALPAVAATAVTVTSPSTRA